MSAADPVTSAGWRRIAHLFGWNRASYFLMSAFLLTLFLIAYVWWPLAEEYLAYIDWAGSWWMYIDWLLIGIFLGMSLLIMAGADLRSDAKVAFVGLVGGLLIESWGTQTELWTYYTLERPPLWIIPAWPIATLSIDRLVRLLKRVSPRVEPAGGVVEKVYRVAYWAILAGFYLLMLWFTAPTLDKPLTRLALMFAGLVILAPADRRTGLLTFLAGSGLGYFLELWGTTRLCWMYYTLEQPPLFAVLAHGMAALAFWRIAVLIGDAWIALQRIPLVRAARTYD